MDNQNCVICKKSMGNSDNTLEGYNVHKHCILERLQINKNWIIQDEQNFSQRDHP